MSPTGRFGVSMLVALFAVALPALAAAKPRLLVLTDIGGDPDDRQSLVRLLVYSNQFDIEGLVASASGTPGELKEEVVRPDLIREQVEAYGQVRTSLAKHERGFPKVEQLRTVIKSGNPQRGKENVGEGHDSEGSSWIIKVADRADPRPLHIAIWGGPTELAQALWRVRKDRSPAAARRFVSKLRVHAIGHQDDSGPWILETFPELFYVFDNVTEEPRRKGVKGPDRRASAYRGMYLGGDEALTSRAWLDAHVRTNHGPLGALYPFAPYTDPNPHKALKEGDTPSWLFFLELGLQDPAHPEWGGWGGRFYRHERQVFRDSPDTVDGITDPRATVWRWRPAFQNDFAARMDWTVKSVKEANHPPHAIVANDRTRRILIRQGKPGATITLDTSRSTDRDGDRLTHRWWIYREAGSYQGTVALGNESAPKLTATIPNDAAGKTIHLILEVSDSGTPPLTSYRRVVLEIASR